ncbi:hypothetical protein Sm713_14210 [Streptomyces sp. TS71-3]|nr:hypothetical protein Sm713_14210 [Streptomyces sp. TS71-3]
MPSAPSACSLRVRLPTRDRLAPTALRSHAPGARRSLTRAARLGYDGVPRPLQTNRNGPAVPTAGPFRRVDIR